MRSQIVRLRSQSTHERWNGLSLLAVHVGLLNLWARLLFRAIMHPAFLHSGVNNKDSEPYVYRDWFVIRKPCRCDDTVKPWLYS
jgi:hypothetical protein